MALFVLTWLAVAAFLIVLDRVDRWTRRKP
jgi:hypothetical protein